MEIGFGNGVGTAGANGKAFECGHAAATAAFKVLDVADQFAFDVHPDAGLAGVGEHLCDQRLHLRHDRGKLLGQRAGTTGVVVGVLGRVEVEEGVVLEAEGFHALQEGARGFDDVEMDLNDDALAGGIVDSLQQRHIVFTGHVRIDALSLLSGDDDDLRAASAGIGPHTPEV